MYFYLFYPSVRNVPSPYNVFRVINIPISAFKRLFGLESLKHLQGNYIQIHPPRGTVL